MMLAQLFTPENAVSLLTLTALEIVLGIDNVIFISILSGKLPKAEQKKARQVGLMLAMGIRICLLLAISWIMGLTAPLFSVLGREISGRALILLVGGLFLIAKSTYEIYEKLEVEPAGHLPGATAGQVARVSFVGTIVQILLLDIVFSLDSVITAVGMARSIPVMMAAMIIAVGVMLLSAGAVSDFVNRHPSMKILALAFLLLIGVMLVAEGFGEHVNKGYIYFAMGFSFIVELLNMRLRKHHVPVQLHSAMPEAELAAKR